MAQNTIIISRIGSGVFEELRLKPGVTTLVPGMLVERSSTGLELPADDESHVPPIVACEDTSVGQGIDELYEENSLVFTWYGRPGDVFYGLLASSESVDIGTPLASAGGGYVKAQSAPLPISAGSVVGHAIEAVTTGVGETKRLKVQIF